MTTRASPKARCFVAMAIGRHDTDEVYDGAIKSAIHGAGLLPIRVDRIIHNDRVDHRIREEISKAAVLVADLTYARPSVYWEAGFAERAVPVVYTCRADHLKQKDSDVHGNLAVHFDLRNANIITWSGVGDKTFKDELSKRLRFVTREARSQQQSQLKQQQARDAFAKLSQGERRATVTFAMESTIRGRGYHRLVGKQSTEPTYGIVRLHKGETRSYWRRMGGTVLLVSLTNCLASARKKDLDWSRTAPIMETNENDRFIEWGKVPDEIKDLSRRRVRRIRRIRIVPTLSKLPEPRIQQALESWRRLPGLQLCFRPALRQPYFLADDNAPLMPTSSEVLFLSGIMSDDEFRQRFLQALNEIENTSDTVITPD